MTYWELVRWGIALARRVPGSAVVPWELVEEAVDAMEAGDAERAREAAEKVALSQARATAAGKAAKRSSDAVDAASSKATAQAAGAAAEASSKATGGRR